MDSTILTIIIAFFSLVTSVCIGVITLVRGSRRESTEQSAGIATLTSDVGYVKSSVDDIKSQQQRADDFMHSIDKQLAEVSNSAKSAHHRLDDHEVRINKLEHEEV